MNLPRSFQEDTFHHLFNRGAFKKTVFFEYNDYLFFQRRLLHYKLKYEIQILTYCLMPNHFHLFVRQKTKEKTISDFLRGLINSYTKTINKKYKRSGVLFEGKTKSNIVYDENAFPVLTKYILLNPVRAKLCKNFYDYEFSSAKTLMGKNDDKITDKLILDYFPDVKSFTNFILKDEELDWFTIFNKKKDDAN